MKGGKLNVNVASVETPYKLEFKQVTYASSGNYGTSLTPVSNLIYYVIS